MARRNFKVTGFARFFLFLIIAAPLTFLGASYYNGEDGIENIKELLGLSSSSSSTETASTTAPPPPPPPPVEDNALEEKIEELEQKNEELRRENAELRQRLKEAHGSLEDKKE